VLAPVGDAVAVGVALARVVARAQLEPVGQAIAVAVGLARVRAAPPLSAVVQAVVIRVAGGLVDPQRQVMSALPAIREPIVVAVCALRHRGGRDGEERDGAGGGETEVAGHEAGSLGLGGSLLMATAPSPPRSRPATRTATLRSPDCGN